MSFCHKMYKIPLYKQSPPFLCTRLESLVPMTFSSIILFPHNLVFLSRNREKIGACILSNHVRDYAIRKAQLFWPDTCISGLFQAALLCHHFFFLTPKFSFYLQNFPRLWFWKTCKFFSSKGFAILKFVHCRGLGPQNLYKKPASLFQNPSILRNR